MSLLNVADYCSYTADLVNYILLTFKNGYYMSTIATQINNKLKTLSTVLPLFSGSIKSRNKKFFP